MPTVTLEEAQARLPELIEQLRPGEEILITRDRTPVAKMTGAEAESADEANETAEKPPRRLGTMKGSVLYMAPDFDAPLDDFREYME